MKDKVVSFPLPESEKFKAALDYFDNNEVGKAADAFSRLVDEGCDDAYYYLGNLYECGGDDLERNYASARFYYLRSVETTGSVQAYLGLIRIKYYGLDGDKNIYEAMEYCSKLSNEIDHPYANFYLGRMYMYGEGVSVNLDVAEGYLLRSWKGGYVFALAFLGIVNCLKGKKIKGWGMRLKSAWMAFKIAYNDEDDPRVRRL